MAFEMGIGDCEAGLESTERAPLAPPSTPHLLVVAADGTWRTQPLPSDGCLTIGRGAVDVRVDERTVSRRHARLEIAATGALRVIDLGSVNGTLVAGKRVADGGTTVRPGEPIAIGRCVLSVHAPVVEPGPAAHAPAGRAGVGALVAKVAPTLISVLLRGETGVGKDVVAEQIHRLSTRAAGPLMRLNCAGLTPALLESELFGHERGAFTGATTCKPGLLEVAAGGTVFLDEIGEMPLEVQAKLLLVIERRVAQRVGATRSVPIDVRFLSATHRDLEAEVRDGRFRADFYYRINGLTIRIPPLRERHDEIDGLVAVFAGEAAARMACPTPVFDAEARARLRHHDWPGNVRELRTVVERAVLLADGGAVTSRVLIDAGLPDGPPPLDAPAHAEHARVIAALERCGHNQSRAARLLGWSRNKLIARMRRYGLVRPRARVTAQ